MRAVVGVFRTRTDAEHGRALLEPLRIPRNRVILLTPQAGEKELASVPHVSGEQPGMGPAVGAVVGGALGLAGGASISEVIAALFVPGVGQILAIGFAGAALLGAVGAASGGAVGGALERNVFQGVPEEELLVYRDALRQGRTVLVAMTDDDQEAAAARCALHHAGAESIDQAREKWWLGLRDVEREHYEADGKNFAEDEREFRRGFEAALRAEFHERSYEDIRVRLQELHPDAYDGDAFRRGYERGQAYLAAIREHNRQAA